MRSIEDRKPATSGVRTGLLALASVRPALAIALLGALGCGGGDFSTSPGLPDAALDGMDGALVIKVPPDGGVGRGTNGDDAPAADEGTAEMADGSSGGGEAGPAAGDGGAEAASSGEAGVTCAPPATLDCNGTCVDPRQPAHCGTCDNACPGPDAGAGQATCTNGMCGLGCTAPTSLSCSGACVDPTELTHCGSCTNACAGPTAGTGSAVCTLGANGGGTCSVNCTGATSLACGDTCFDPADPNHCGSCTHQCPPPPSGNGQATCASPPACGVSCVAGTHVCNGDCLSNADLPSDAADPCILTSQFGTFVATTGSDTPGGGTPNAPYATLSYALAHLAGTSRVYVCDGTYSDRVTISSAVGIYGGLSCARGNWSYVGGKANMISTSPAGAPALTVSSVTGLVQIEDMGFESQNATGLDSAGNGLSSIAVLVNVSSNVSLVRCALNAGNGASASPTKPATGANYSNGTTAPAGSPGSGSAGGVGGSTTGAGACVYGSSAGGTGDLTPLGTGTDGSSTPAASVGGSPFDGKGGTESTSGDSGASGAAGSPGVAAVSHGTLSMSGWTPSGGGNGGPGNPGQGGGGGGLGDSGGGPGAGSGGCGGAGGAGGTGGGASIALASVASSVTLDVGCTLVTGTGGTGQPGGDAQVGQNGGGPARPGIDSTLNAGAGGNGGGGAGGAGGSAGISVCIVVGSGSGTFLTSAATCTPSAPGQPGTGGAGGAGGNNGDGDPGATGASGSAGFGGTATSPLSVL
jgi:hypothetical protein